MSSIISDNIRRLISEYFFKIDSPCGDEDLSCTICHRLVVDAYQSFCGCKYCRECAFTYLNEGNTHCCGGKEDCQEEPLVIDSNINKSSLLDKKILKVRVHCPNEQCEIITKLPDMDDHLRVCSKQSMECPYTRIGCENGEASKSEVENHLVKELLAHNRLLVEVIDNLKNEVGGLKTDLQQCKLEIAFLKEKLNLKEKEIVKENFESEDIEQLPVLEYAEKTNETNKEQQLYSEECSLAKSGVNLFIKNLGKRITDDRLREEFIEFGNITSAKVMLDPENNTSRGFGFVCFSSPDEASRAISEMNGKIVEGKTLYVALAQKKKDRVTQLRSQFKDRLNQTNDDSLEFKELLGDKIYQLVKKQAGGMAGTITGLFLELDNVQLLDMIENEETLRMKVDEAMAVLNVHKS